MDIRTQRAMAGLMETVANLNADDFHVFLHYSGHVEKIGIDICLNGWNGKNYSHEFYTYADADEPVEAIHKIEDELISIHDKFRKEQK